MHCCRMCRFFDPAVTKKCTEDDAEEVKEKARSNFCDYFSPSDKVFDPALTAGEARAKKELGSLFGAADGEDEQGGSDASSDAKDLFR
jgi:hypothetical protein